MQIANGTKNKSKRKSETTLRLMKMKTHTKTYWVQLQQCLKENVWQLMPIYRKKKELK